MVHKLFENFLDSAEMYEACTRYWNRLIHDIEDSLGQNGEWQHWILDRYPDGERVEMDGNPIYDGRSRKLDRAIRIVQHRSAGGDPEIVAWVEKHEEEYYELSEFPRTELVLNLSLSEESGQIARQLLRMWMTPTTTAEDMKRFIRERFESKS